MQELIFLVLFLLLSFVVFFEVFIRKHDEKSNAPEYRRLRNIYTIGYLIFKFSDWLGGPYFYKVYESKGLSREAITNIFLTGFISAMIFGTFVGSLADRIGRKRGCQLCAFFFGLSCLSTHSSSYAVLLLGRLSGGIGASLLHSCFEAWMVSEHKRRNLSMESRGHILGLVTLGDSVCAVFAGFGAQGARMFAEYTGPFDTSLICLISGFAFITMFWPENFGNAKGTTSATSNLREAFNLVRSSPPMTMLGCSVACFESAMYVFVFQWSGALQRSASIEGKGEIPLGLVFACFMAAIMVGSRFFVFASAALEPQAFLPGVIFLSSVSLFITASQPPFLVLLACLMIFELSCGVYFPSIAVLRARIIPEQVRATVMNLFRVPLNALVILVLFVSRSASERAVFFCASFLLAMCCYCLTTLKKTPLPSPNAMVSPPSRRGAVNTQPCNTNTK